MQLGFHYLKDDTTMVLNNNSWERAFVRGKISKMHSSNQNSLSKMSSTRSFTERFCVHAECSLVKDGSLSRVPEYDKIIIRVKSNSE